MMKKMVLTEQERQLVEYLRQLREADEICLTIRRETGAWEIEMSAGITDKIKGRGVGRTFGAAWDDITGLSFG